MFDRAKTSSQAGVADISFYVDTEMIHVLEQKAAPTFVDPLLDGIRKLDATLKLAKKSN